MAQLSDTKPQIILLTLFSSLFWFMIGGGTVGALFVLRELHATPAQLSLSVTAGVITGLLLDIPTSAIADRRGRKPILVAAVLFGIAGMIIAALSQNFTIYLISSVCVATYAALRQGAIEAMLYDRIMRGAYKARYHYIMSRFGIYSLVFSTLAPLVGGFIAGHWGVRTAFWVGIVPMAMLLVLLCFIREPKRHYQTSQRKTLGHIWHTIKQINASPATAYYFRFNLTLWMYATIFNSFSAMYMVSLGFSAGTVGLLAGANGFCVLLGHILFRNQRQASPWPIVLLIGLLVGAMTVAQPIVSVALFLAQAVLVGGLTAVLDREKQLAMPDDVRATMLSVFSIAVQVLFIPLSILFGWLANGSVRTAFVGIGVVFLCGALFLAVRKPPAIAQAAEAATPEIENG